MNGRRKIICLGKVALLTTALLSGIYCSVNVRQNHIIPTETCEIITLSHMIKWIGSFIYDHMEFFGVAVFIGVSYAAMYGVCWLLVYGL